MLNFWFIILGIVAPWAYPIVVGAVACSDPIIPQCSYWACH